MFNKNTHIFPFLFFFSSGFFLISCHSIKSTKKSNTDNLSQSESAKKEHDEISFGNNFINGCSERMKGNLPEALRIFDECKKQKPENPAVDYELAIIYKQQGVQDMALASAKKAANTGIKNEWYQLLLIDCYLAQRKFNDAITTREMLVKNFPERIDFKHDLAMAYAMNGNYDKSLKIFNDLEKSFGKDESIVMSKVKLMKNMKHFKEAEQELIKLCSWDKDETRYLNFLAEFYIETNQTEKAKEIYNKIVAIEPENPTVNLSLSDYYKYKGDEKKAFQYLLRAFQNPELEIKIKTEILSEYYLSAERGNPIDYGNGLQLAETMVQQHAESPVANALYADFLKLQNKNKDAGLYYYKSCIYDKNNFRVWQNLLYMDQLNAQFDSLEHHSNEAKELFPNQPSNYFYNGLANSQLKNFSKAAQSLKDGLEYAGSDKRLMLDFLTLLGEAYNSLKEYPKSDKAYEDALKIDADNSLVLNNYAYYLSIRKEKLSDAEKFSKRAVELRPNDGNYMDTYAWVFYAGKKYKDAAEWLEKAVKLSPSNGEIHEHYGDSLYKLNRIEEAVAEWNKAKENGSNSETLLKKIKEKKLND